MKEDTEGPGRPSEVVVNAELRILCAIREDDDMLSNVAVGE